MAFPILLALTIAEKLLVMYENRRNKHEKVTNTHFKSTLLERVHLAMDARRRQSTGDQRSTDGK